MLNVVTGEEGYPAAVLLRGAGEWVGPARLTKALGVDKQFNGRPAAEGSGLWIEDRGVLVRRSAVRARRALAWITPASGRPGPIDTSPSRR